MPKIRNEPPRASSSSLLHRDSKFVVVSDGGKRVLLTRAMLSPSYDDALDVMASHFETIPRAKMMLQTDKLEACQGEFVNIPRESWKEVLPHLMSVKLVESDVQIPRQAPVTPSPSLPSSSQSPRMSITIENSAGTRVELDVKSPNTLISTLLTTYCRHMKVDDASTSLFNGSKLLPLDTTLSSLSLRNGTILSARLNTSLDTPSNPKFSIFILYKQERYGFVVSSSTRTSSLVNTFMSRFHKGDPCDPPKFIVSDSSDRMSCQPEEKIGDFALENGDEIIALDEQKGGKPVIYLFAPKPVDACVRLSLVKEWAFSAIYPVVPIKTFPPVGQTLEWRVTTNPDGSLLEHTSGMKTSYLYWESETRTGHRPPSPPPSPSLQPSFNPIYSTLSDADSVVIPTSCITTYLDAALTVLTLHLEARTSFVTYWLPSFLKHDYIALRFVPQSAYEKAAPLEVTPQPDVLTRVFMLWKGVKLDDDGGLWSEAVKRASEDVEAWKGVVGIQELPSMFDSTKFRVLEWGGMEIKV